MCRAESTSGIAAHSNNSTTTVFFFFFQFCIGKTKESAHFNCTAVIFVPGNGRVLLADILLYSAIFVLYDVNPQTSFVESIERFPRAGRVGVMNDAGVWV